MALYYRDELSRTRKAEQEAKAQSGEREKDTCRVEGPYSRESAAIKPAKITCNSSRIDQRRVCTPAQSEHRPTQMAGTTVSVRQVAADYIATDQLGSIYQMGSTRLCPSENLPLPML